MPERKELTALGKAIAHKQVEHNLLRSEVAGQIGVSANLLHKLQHGGPVKEESVEKAITWLGGSITGEQAEQFRVEARHKPLVVSFEVSPNTVAEHFFNQLYAIRPELSDDNLNAILAFIAGGCSLGDNIPEDEGEWIEVTPETRAVGAAAAAPTPTPESMAAIRGTPNHELESLNEQMATAVTEEAAAVIQEGAISPEHMAQDRIDTPAAGDGLGQAIVDSQRAREAQAQGADTDL